MNRVETDCYPLTQKAAMKSSNHKNVMFEESRVILFSVNF